MDRDGLFSALLEARLGEGDVLDVERRGDQYQPSAFNGGAFQQHLALRRNAGG